MKKLLTIGRKCGIIWAQSKRNAQKKIKNEVKKMERLEYNKLFVDGTQYTDSELRKILDNLKDGEVLELVEVDRHGNLHFEIHTYGMYY